MSVSTEVAAVVNCYFMLYFAPVPDRSLLVLTLLVMISNVVLKMTFCIVLHIYRYQKLPGKGILGLSGWYTVQGN